MQFMIVLVIFLVTVDKGICGRAGGNIFHDLLQRGKSFFSRSFELRHFSEPEAVNIFPEHRVQYQNLELLEDDSAQSQPNNLDQIRPQSKDYRDKENEDLGFIYRTDIIENDNMDLYSLIGGISFASLLAATLFVLGRNRRNGSNAKSLDEIFGDSARESMGYRHFNSDTLEQLTKALSKSYVKQPRQRASSQSSALI